MKKISSNIIIFLLVTTFLWGGVNFNFVKKANAQSGNAPAGSISAPVGGGIPTVGNNSTQTGTTPASTASSTKPSKWSFGTIISKAAAKAADVVAGGFGLIWYGPVALLLTVIGLILNAIVGIQAGIFDGLLMISMAQFGPIIESTGIVTAWTIIRNLINVSFIFIILYIAISIILGSFGPKKKSTVAGVVISALLINYSMFITRVIIDFGNIIATAIYNTPSGAFNTLGVMQVLQLQTILSPNIILASGQITSIVLMLLQIIMVGTFIAVLFRGTLFMLGRLIALLVLLALSPIGFVGFGIPWIKDKSDEWWTALIGQVFLLPVFLFFLMMTNTMLKAGKSIISAFDIAFNNGAITSFQPGQWVYFGLIIGMLHLSTKMTKDFAGKRMSDLVDKAAKGMKYAASAVIAVGASVATGGAAAAPMAARLAGMAAKGGVTGAVGRIGMGASSLATKAAAPVAKVLKQPGLVGDLSRDLLKNTLSGVKEHTGLDIDAANKSIKEYQKNYEKFAGERANEIGPGKVDAEIKNRKETMENIEGQAKNRLANDDDGKKLNKALGDTAKRIEDLTNTISGIDEAIGNTTDPTTKSNLENNKKRQQTELAEQQKTAENIKKAQKDREKTLLGGLKKQIGQEIGYDTETHDAEIEILEQEKIVREKALNEHLKDLSKGGYYNKKAAETLRAAKGKYKAKSKEEEWLDEVRKKMKEDAKNEEKGSTKEGKEEKK